MKTIGWLHIKFMHLRVRAEMEVQEQIVLNMPRAHSSSHSATTKLRINTTDTLLLPFIKINCVKKVLKNKKKERGEKNKK